MSDEPELWTALQRLTQRRIAADGETIAAASDLANDIRFIYLLLSSPADCARAAEVIRRFGRAMIHMPASAADALVKQLRSEGFIAKTGLSALSGAADIVLPLSEALVARSVLPDGITAMAVTDGLPAGDVARIQALQHASGLIPMPAAAITDSSTCGVVLRDPAGAVAGFASLLPLASGARRQGFYLVNGVVVDPIWRGRGLGALLTAMTIARARDVGATTFLSSVDVENRASVAMQRICGLDHDKSHAFIFARVSEEDEAVMVAGEGAPDQPAGGRLAGWMPSAG